MVCYLSKPVTIYPQGRFGCIFICVFLTLSPIRKITICFVMNFVQVLPTSGRLVTTCSLTDSLPWNRVYTTHPVTPAQAARCFATSGGVVSSKPFSDLPWQNGTHSIQEAQLSPKDRAMRRVNWNLANCHATVQKLLIRQVLNKSMVRSWRFSRRQCVIDNVHSTMTRPSRLPLSQVS